MSSILAANSQATVPRTGQRAGGSACSPINVPRALAIGARGNEHCGVNWQSYSPVDFGTAIFREVSNNDSTLCSDYWRSSRTSQLYRVCVREA